MPRYVLPAICLFALFFQGGCLYCAYPRIDYTAPVQLDGSNDIHAFRVDTTNQGIVTLGGFIHVPEDQLWKLDEYIHSQHLSELAALPTGEIPAQFKLSVSYGLLIPILVANALTHTSHSVSVRLYRPGYELVEINSWEKGTRISWKAIHDVEGQEKTLDRLFSWPLEAGSTSTGNRNALLFGAAEYARLTASAPSRELQARLAEKARTLREQAEK
jgi:hypothetical protein